MQQEESFHLVFESCQLVRQSWGWDNSERCVVPQCLWVLLSRALQLQRSPARKK